MSRWLLRVSGDGDSTTSLGNLCQPSVTLTLKRFFRCSEGTSCVPACARGLCPGTGHRWEEPGSVLLHPPCRY